MKIFTILRNYRVILTFIIIQKFVKKKVYVVWKGRTPGIYNTWEECKQHVEGFAEAKYMGFESHEKAMQAFTKSFEHFITKKTSQQHTDTTSHPIILESISVDAACNVNTGIMEYKGVFTKTRKVLFHKGPFEGASNNIGEFLAIVHAMSYMQKHGIYYPIYTDSHTAMTWVRKKEIRTKVKMSDQIAQLNVKAISWLHENKTEFTILKWHTNMWGEIYADFGRK
jgi:ribonuclease HI